MSIIERRSEQRVPAAIEVRVFGLDAEGTRFEQGAIAANISFGGALLAGLAQTLRPSDLVVVRYRQKQACFRVVWTRNSGNERKIQAAVQRRETDECPWEELLPARAAVARIYKESRAEP